MYGDDFAIFADDPAWGRSVVAAVDRHLRGLLGLQRNPGKTKEFFDAVEAAAAVENTALDYLAASDRAGDDTSAPLLYEFWDEEVLPAREPNLSEMHFVLGRLGKRGDAYAVRSLLDRRDLIALDPRSAIDYITETSSGSELLAEAERSSHNARHAHDGGRAPPRLPPPRGGRSRIRRRSRSRARRGRPRRVPGPTRAMAVQARARCPSWGFADAVERAEAEPDFWVRRSLVGATKRLRDRPRTNRLALRDLARRDRSLIPTAAWAVAA